ncbi:NmrA family NAD(P)-binding protein, partial [Intrasporangium sp.]|uniref:NmrA family NAD(P)-binding protein n=1 Tax=Intrasporangium sp. TaxID=1925024 RepID=UPI00293A2025
MSEVLVIGAAGKTGRAVTRALLARGVRVRAAVRPGSTGLPYAAGLGSRSIPPPAPPQSSGPDVHTPPGETRATRV